MDSQKDSCMNLLLVSQKHKGGNNQKDNKIEKTTTNPSTLLNQTMMIIKYATPNKMIVNVNRLEENTVHANGQMEKQYKQYYAGVTTV